MNRRKKITVIILLLLTVIIGGLAIYVSIRIRQDNSPTSNKADTTSISQTDINNACKNTKPTSDSDSVGVISSGTNGNNNSCALNGCAATQASIQCTDYQNGNQQSGIRDICISTTACGASGSNVSACTLDMSKGNASCHPVSNWNGVDPNALAKSAAQKNLGTTYMATCDNGVANATSDPSKLSSCNCPGVPTPATGCSSNICGACQNPVYNCADTSGGGSSSTGYGCGTCTPAEVAGVPACAGHPDQCGKIGPGYPCQHLECGGTTSTSEGAYAYCQDDGGPAYPLKDVGVTLIQNAVPEGSANHSFNKTTDSNGRILFNTLQTYPHTAFTAELQQSGGGVWSRSSPALSYLSDHTLPTGQTYDKLTAPSFINCNDPTHYYFYYQNSASTNYCNNGGDPDQATAYGFEIPDNYASGRTGMVFRFRNCGNITSSSSSSSSSSTPPTVATIRVHAQCQDPGGPVYPLANVQVPFQRFFNGANQIITQSTNSSGYTDYPIFTNQSPFAARLDQSSLNGTLPTGQPYTSMNLASQNAINCSNGNLTQCTGGIPGNPGNFCGSNGSTYESCILNPGATPDLNSFVFNFTGCTPPVITNRQCQQTCNTTNNLCDTTQPQLSCISGICKRTDNPNSITCSPLVTNVQCNQTCDSSNQCDTSKNLTCQTNLTPNVCRLTSNLSSSTCTPLVTNVQCNQTCDQNNLCDTSKNLSCSNGSCRLTSNLSSSTCTPLVTNVQCNQTCDQNNLCDISKGLSCISSTCKLTSNPGSANCSPTNSNSINLNVNVLCKDGTGPSYPIQNATVNITGTGFAPPNQTTDSTGLTQFSGIQGNSPFNIGVSSLSGATLVGSTQNVTSLSTNPAALSCSNGTVTSCTGGTGNYCGANNASFANCSLAGNNGTVTSYNFTLQYSNCLPSVCKAIDKIGPDPIKSGAGNIISFKVTYQNPSTSNPYPNIKLRVSQSGSTTPVGRDNTNNISNLVAPSTQSGSISYNSQNSTWTYIFTWEAAEPTTNTPTAGGTYDVKVLSDGTNISPADSACNTTLTVTPNAPQQPIFNIVKTSSQTCDTNGDDVFTYNLVVTNLGPVDGSINQVQDTYDSKLNGLSILPNNINPSFGLVGSGKITWVGDNLALSFTKNQSKTYSYTIRIPKANISNFSNGVKNTAQVQYVNISSNTNTNVNFDLISMPQCSPITGTKLPNTSILDDSRFFLMGVSLIILGYLIYKYRLGSIYSQRFINKVGNKINNFEIKVPFKPFEDSIMDDLEKRRSKNKIRK